MVVSKIKKIQFKSIGFHINPNDSIETIKNYKQVQTKQRNITIYVKNNKIKQYNILKTKKQHVFKLML